MNATTVTAVGTLITPVTKKRLPDGSNRVFFRIACNERRYDRATAGWVDGDTFYVSVLCWRRLAENVHASLLIGDPIVVRGRVFTRSYDKDGRRNSVTEIEADAVGPDLTRCTAAIRRNGPAVHREMPTDDENEGVNRAPAWADGGPDADEERPLEEVEYREVADAVPVGGG